MIILQCVEISLTERTRTYLFRIRIGNPPWNLRRVDEDDVDWPDWADNYDDLLGQRAHFTNGKVSWIDPREG